VFHAIDDAIRDTIESGIRAAGFPLTGHGARHEAHHPA